MKNIIINNTRTRCKHDIVQNKGYMKKAIGDFSENIAAVAGDCAESRSYGSRSISAAVGGRACSKADAGYSISALVGKGGTAEVSKSSSIAATVGNNSAAYAGPGSEGESIASAIGDNTSVTADAKSSIATVIGDGSGIDTTKERSAGVIIGESCVGRLKGSHSSMIAIGRVNAISVEGAFCTVDLTHQNYGEVNMIGRCGVAIVNHNVVVKGCLGTTVIFVDRTGDNTLTYTIVIDGNKYMPNTTYSVVDGEVKEVADTDSYL